jgi:DNA-binding response OmpR family regulator
MRILIAEDEASSRNMLASVLAHDGHEVVLTVNGSEAWLELQKPDAPRLVILDWIMPIMDGLEVVRCIQEMPPPGKPYLILVTVRGNKSDVVTGLGAGANDYIAKPYDAGELLARVEVGRRLIETQDALAAKIEELQRALEDIRTLRGILPICSNCKKIRDDDGYWNQVESYLQQHTGAEFTHSVCPECIEKLYPDLPHRKLR